MDDLQERLKALETTVQALSDEKQTIKHRLARAEHRLRATWTCAFIGAVGAVVLGSNPEARAQFGVTLTSLNNRLMVVENKTQDMSRIVDPNTGQNTVRFSGVNVQVVDGSGDTFGAVNGTGNLLVGYNELKGLFGTDMNIRTGSHNLVVGSLNNYSNFGGFVAGAFNTISGQFASVSGGIGNTASGVVASAGGGFGNTASGFYASVSGGENITQANLVGWSAGGNGGAGTFHSP